MLQQRQDQHNKDYIKRIRTEYKKLEKSIDQKIHEKCMEYEDLYSKMSAMFIENTELLVKGDSDHLTIEEQMKSINQLKDMERELLEQRDTMHVKFKAAREQIDEAMETIQKNEEKIEEQEN